MLRLSSPQTKVIAVDAIGSLIFGGPNRKRLIPGHGASLCPALFSEDLADEFVQVGDPECVIGCRTLLASEALLVGGSSGAVFMAVKQMSRYIRPSSRVVAIFPDRGDRYLDTIFSDEWVNQHFSEEECDSAMRTHGRH